MPAIAKQDISPINLTQLVKKLSTIEEIAQNLSERNTLGRNTVFISYFVKPYNIMSISDLHRLPFDTRIYRASAIANIS